MKWIFLLLFPLAATHSFSQQAKSYQQEPPYKQYPTLPTIELLQPDSNKLTNADLKKQPTLIMYFSPDCEHCIKQMDEMNKRMQEFKKIQIVLVTNQPMEHLVDFVAKYKLGAYPNIRPGQDVKFTLPGFYRMKSLPYFALYDKNWKLITTFESNTEVDKILNAFTKGKP
jgi:cytochrome oxidase Cu insertion factor (SCO1/SenC/PrrC family)